MNKGELIAKLAERAGMTKKDARKALDTLIEIIIETVSKNEEVLLTGFGKFEARARKESQ
ncbi:TPA: integration host factor subunit alpha, partial [Candidatus Micrarchaeota archaeon]|nr:integration host factor subunit alpha [Candidatus Micrarchaeota archaeon]